MIILDYRKIKELTGKKHYYARIVFNGKVRVTPFFKTLTGAQNWSKRLVERYKRMKGAENEIDSD